VAAPLRRGGIGVRLAVGAKARQVRLQFLLEAILLTMVGGIAGVVLGVVAAYFTARFLDWPPVISAPTVVLGLGISTAVGLLFGYYPAFTASRLDRIDALRFE
jgi:putative ABC transport system permease protein